jgi:HK97 gp10 family phage protein
MKKGISLTIDNKELIKLNKDFKIFSSKVNLAGSQGLEKAGMRILADAQTKLKEDNIIGTGQLINSGKVLKDTDGSVDVAFNARHAGAVEFGRKAAIPPYKPILEWVKKKGIADTYNIKTKKRASRGAIGASDFYKRATSIAIAIAKSLGKHPTKAIPFLYPAFRKNEQEVIEVLRQAIKKVI